MSKVYFGIDLGTSNSSISYIVESPRSAKAPFVEPTTVKFRPPPGASFIQNWQRFPSMVYIAQKGRHNRFIAGFLAQIEAIGKRAKPFENIFMSVKSDMGTLKVYEDSVDPEILTPVEVSAKIIKALVEQAEKETGVSPCKGNVVISVPASFTHNQREDTLKAARLAGLSIGEGDLLDEPIAAFIHTACHQKLDAQMDMKRPKKILVFDLGAGTCDVSIFEACYREDNLLSPSIGLEINNLAISNYEKLGGDNIDFHIVEKELLPFFCKYNGIEFAALQEKEKRKLRYRLKHTAKKLKEEICRELELDQKSKGKKTIKQPWTIDSFVLGESRLKTKRTSHKTDASVFKELMEPFVEYDIKRSFQIFDDYVACSFFLPVYNALEKANLNPEDIQGFIFNGGGCHNPIIRETLRGYEGFSRARFFDTPDIDLSVSKGAAIHCYFLHRHKKSLIAPIVNSEIGLITHGIKREKLISAGAILPFPRDAEFLVNDEFRLPKDGMDSVGISLYSGDGFIISNIRMPLPSDTHKGDRVAIGIRMDVNKVMTLTAFMRNKPESKINVELRNPWTHRIKTPEDIAANEIWEQVAQLKKSKKPVPNEMMINLANKERLRGNISGAIEILQRLEDKGINTAGLNNLLALCYSNLGLARKALDYYKKAVELDPDNATILVNYGAQLIKFGNVEEAISMIRQAVSLDSEYFFPYYWLGIAYRKKGEEGKAMREFRRAIQILRDHSARYPNDEFLLNYLIETEIALGNYEEADEAIIRLRNIQNAKILGGDPDDLIVGSDTQMYVMEGYFETQEGHKK